MPKISVIVPVYKAEQYLDACVSSILKQTFSDFELILVDDGSPDSSPRLCDDWAKMDKRVRVIHKENGGVQTAIIIGTAASQGKYIGYVDSDDWIAEDYFEKLVSPMDEYDADMVVSGWIVHDGSEEISRIMQPECQIMSSQQIETEILEPFWEQFSELNTIGNFRWNKLWRRELLFPILESLSPRLGIGEDLEQVLRYLPLCKRLVTASRCTGYYYRTNNNSATRCFSDKMIEQYKIRNEVLRNVALDQGRPYCAREQRESIYNFRCLYWAYTSNMGILRKYRSFKQILKNGPISISEQCGYFEKFGFIMLKKGYYILGTIFLESLLFVYHIYLFFKKLQKEN